MPNGKYTLTCTKAHRFTCMQKHVNVNINTHTPKGSLPVCDQIRIFSSNLEHTAGSWQIILVLHNSHFVKAPPSYFIYLFSASIHKSWMASLWMYSCVFTRLCVHFECLSQKCDLSIPRGMCIVVKEKGAYFSIYHGS